MIKPYRSFGVWTGPRTRSPMPFPPLRDALSQIWGPVRSVGATTFAFFKPHEPCTIAACSDDERLVANIILAPDGQMQIVFRTSDPELENATVRFDVRVITDEAAEPVPFMEGEGRLSPREGGCRIEPLKQGIILLVRFAVLDR